MKINLIPTYASGGGTYAPPYPVYQSIPTASEQTQAAASSSSDSKDLTDKDLLSILDKLEGLPSDSEVIKNQLKRFYLSRSAGSRGSLVTNTANIAARYIDIVNQAKVANFNRKEYDNAYDQVSKNGGINEVAINERGQFVCMNADGDFKFMSAEQLKDSDGSYAPLTNSELLFYRANDTSLAFKNQLLSVVQNGIGMETVTDMIQKIIGNLGSEESSQEGYVSTKKGKIIQGLQDFEKAVTESSSNGNYNSTISDLYKYKYLTKSQATQASEALAYVYAALPANAKALLKSKTDLTDEGAQKMIETLISSRLTTKTQFDIDLEGGPTAQSLKSASGSSSSGLQSSQLVELVKNISGVKQGMTVDRGDGIQMSVFGRQFNLLTGRDGKAITNTSLSNMLSESGIQGLVKDMQNITFGDQKLSPEALAGVTYNNTGAIRVNLPIKPDGSVNLDLLEAFEKVEKTLDELGHEPTAEEVKAVYEENGLANLLKANGMPDENKFGAFLVTEGYTTDALSGVHSSSFVKEYQGDTDAAIATIKDSLKVGTGKQAVVPSIDNFTWINPFDWFGNYDKVFKAAIYIPIDNNAALAARLDKQKLDYYNVALGEEEKYQNSDKQVALQPTSSDVLNNQ